MKFTIITVVRNEENSIAETINSVIEQNYKKFEYLIIDGKSSDRTIEIATNLIKNSDQDVKLFSEPDSGVYNAMNKGIQKASGDFVIFINAGDKLYDKFVLKKLSKFINQKRNRIYYGKIYRVHCARGVDRIKDFSKIARYPLYGFLNKEMPCHQGIIAPVRSLKEFLFNEEYKFCADFDWLIRCYKSGYKLVNTDCMICKYDDTGLTSRRENREQMNKESSKILQRNFPVMFRALHIVERLKEIFC